ncbi:class I SAM-dependent methyltransferase [Jiangella anatolica]|uniref:SAM-dependent methyltransferase n=1 Tax=Jiangella anatolica TaxID=2670374 RepID=A0A2W2AWD1_9ACTN|nr:class I SAM-dependent methyltransferase [Jiangella anatolica]PZF79491.1 SAM-dependent methyltransferase [Jiangella anatolica]
MPDAIFAHPRLAPLYDVFGGDDRPDLDAYVALAAELEADRILDVGCGTGSLAVRLAAAGHTVVGADPAEASLAVARSKDPDGLVTWVHAGADAVPAVDADLAVMTGNVAQVFLTDEEWTAALRGVHAALRPSGTLVFETRRPERRVWEEWVADWPGGVTVRDVPGIGPVERSGEVTEVAPPYISFYGAYRFPDGEIVRSESTLRFRDHDEIVASLTATGYRVTDVRDAPDRPGLEFVFLAERTS